MSVLLKISSSLKWSSLFPIPFTLAAPITISVTVRPGPKPGLPSCYVSSLCPSHPHSMALLRSWLLACCATSAPVADYQSVTDTICHRIDYLSRRRPGSPMQIYLCSWSHATSSQAQDLPLSYPFPSRFLDFLQDIFFGRCDRWFSVSLAFSAPVPSHAPSFSPQQLDCPCSLEPVAYEPCLK